MNFCPTFPFSLQESQQELKKVNPTQENVQKDDISVWIQQDKSPSVSNRIKKGDSAKNPLKEENDCV